MTRCNVASVNILPCINALACRKFCEVISFQKCTTWVYLEKSYAAIFALYSAGSTIRRLCNVP